MRKYPPLISTCLIVAALAVGAADRAVAEDTLRLAVGQRGLWDTSISEVGQQRHFQEARARA